MKIRKIAMSYRDVLALPQQQRKKPKKPSRFFRFLIRMLSNSEMKKIHFKYNMVGMEKLDKDTPCLILMNHSCFTDLMIAFRIFYPRPFNIVCTSDGFVGKEWLMRTIGCIPTAKFVNDTALVRDLLCAVNTLKTSVLLYPEASYSFDGTATPLPSSVGKLLKLLKVPVVMVRTYGAFLRDPLYNNLQVRQTDVSADVEYLLSPEDISIKTVDELNAILKEQFTFDNFRWQQENGVIIDEPFRADHLNRVLYKCPHCRIEGKMVGKGTSITCTACGKGYELTEDGYLKALNGDVAFTHVPDWYRWERECVRKEIEDGTYRLAIPVRICVMKDTKAIYEVGTGTLEHTRDGFRLTGCDGALDYRQKPAASYSLYSDYFWYEIGDVICIGKPDLLYYCFPLNGGDVVAKTRMATEELYKIEAKSAVT